MKNWKWIVVILTSTLLSGCWDRVEIEDRAIVLGISIDDATEETQNDGSEHKEEREVSHLRGKYPTPNTEMIRVALQIALPGRVSLGPSQGGGGGAGPEQTVWVMSAGGHTLNDAIMNLQQKVSTQIFFGHLRIIVVSEKVAARGLQSINDYLRRNSEVRSTTWMMVSKGNAEQLMKAAPKLSRLPTLYLLSAMEEAIRIGQFPDNTIGKFWSYSTMKGQEGFLPCVEQDKKEDTIAIEGIAYFQGEKLTGVTKPLEIGAYMAIKGINPGGYRAFVKVPGTDDVVDLAATRRNSNMEVKIKSGRPHFTVRVHMEFKLEEKSSEQFAIDDEMLRRIEREAEKSSQKMQEGLIRQTQKKGSDIFGFGEYVRAKKPNYWNNEIKTKEKWQKMYKEIKVDVHVTAKIRRVGMKAK